MFFDFSCRLKVIASDLFFTVLTARGTLSTTGSTHLPLKVPPPPHPVLVAAPGLLEDLAKLPPRDSLPGMISREVSEVGGAPSAVVTPPRLDEKAFLAALRQDACGTGVLTSSVEGFTRDTLALGYAIAKAKQ